MLLIVSVLILIFGLAATTRTQNITVGGYYPGVIVSAHSTQQICLCSYKVRCEGSEWLQQAFPAERITESPWWVDFPHIHYLALLSLEAEWSKVSQPINVFSSQYSASSILESPLSATFSRILLLTLTSVSSEVSPEEGNVALQHATEITFDLINPLI